MRLDKAEALRRAAGADHGVLATLHPERGADLVPACFAVVGEVVAVPVDRLKPKSPGRLGRVRNLATDPRATLLVERWDARDWERLWWVRLTLRRSSEEPGVAAALDRAIRDRYPQYRDAPFDELLTFRIEDVAGWSAS